jgi:sugar transferase (PEP-CTERM system associated)
MSFYFLILALIESVVLFAGLCVGAYFYSGENFVSGTLVLESAVFAAIAMGGMLSVGLYRARQRVAFSETLARIATALTLAAIANTTLYYLLPTVAVPPKVQGYALILAAVSLIAVRMAFYTYAGIERFKRNVLVYGQGETAAALAKLCAGPGGRSFRIVGYICVPGEQPSPRCAPVLEHGDSLLELARARNIDEIVVALDNRRKAVPVRALVDCRFSGIKITEALTFAERETGKIDLSALRPSWFIYGDGFRQGTLDRTLKRAFDVVASLAVLVVALPLVALGAVAIAIESRGKGGVLFRQERVGQYGKIFNMLKLRSMIPDAEKDGRARWAARSDPRVTKVGALMRRLRIDELPQILNVLRGEMSFVGPRPERPEFVKSLSEQLSFYDERHCVKPGLTGWAQVSYPYGASVNDAREKLQYDLFYVKHHSPVFDFLILVQTLEIVIWSRAHPSAATEAEVALEESIGELAVAADSTAVADDSELVVVAASPRIDPRPSHGSRDRARRIA